MVGQLMDDDLEGSSHGLTEALSWHFSGGIKKPHRTAVRTASVPTKIAKEHLPDTSLESYHYIYQLSDYYHVQLLFMYF
jgi:hypothetical protein